MLLKPALFLALIAGALSATVPAYTSDIVKRADPYVGYFFVHFYDRDPAIYAHLSNGNNPINYRTLNKDAAILRATSGTRAARDPYLVSRPDSAKHWIIATDLDIAAINNDWGQAVSRGSRAIHVWESSDLVNWSASRLATVMPATAGMVWAPEAVWDPSRNAFLVHWASRVFSANDPNHTGSSTSNQIWYSHTTDFVTFTTPALYYSSSSTGVIDLAFLAQGGNSFVRYIKNENLLRVWQERSTNGLFGPWTRSGSGYLTNTVTEGPLTFVQNDRPTRTWVFLDDYGGDSQYKGYIPFYSDNVNASTPTWTLGSTSNFPKNVKHGVVKPVTQAEYNRISARWP